MMALPNPKRVELFRAHAVAVRSERQYLVANSRGFVDEAHEALWGSHRYR